MKITIDINLEKFRYSLVGNGYLLEEVKAMSEERLIAIFTQRANSHIDMEYWRTKERGLLNNK